MIPPIRTPLPGSFYKGASMSYGYDICPTTVTRPVRGKGQIENRTGGFGFEVTDEERLKRFLILGHQGGTYYADQRTLTWETVDCIDRLPAARAIEIICEISDAGRAPKNDPAIFALAYITAKRDPAVTGLVLSGAIRKVCRTGTHLFDYLNNCKALGRGWGPAFCRAISDWYDRSPLSLARQVTKYAQRNGWTHRDVLRKCHAQAPTPTLNAVYAYAAQKDGWASMFTDMATMDMEAIDFLWAVNAAQDPAATDKQRIRLIENHGLEREHMPTASLNNPAIWEALLPGMGLTALIRNLGKMTSVGLLQPLSAAQDLVLKKITDPVQLKAQRLHPVAILIAQRTYAQGRGTLGSLSWRPNQVVIAALEDAFYKAFDAVEPTGKRVMLGVDVSGSMGQHRCAGCNLITAREAACIMAMLAARTEPNHFLHAFSGGFVELQINKNTTLAQAVEYTRTLPFAHTDCSVPMKYALENNLNVDAFCIYTDNETNHGEHPFQALQNYRRATGIAAKCAVFGFANTNFTVADPNDAGMMDFIGFDAAAPTLLSQFIRS